MGKFRIRRIRGGVRYDFEYRGSLNGAEELARRHVTEDHSLAPQEVVIEQRVEKTYSTDPRGVYLSWEPVRRFVNARLA